MESSELISISEDLHEDGETFPSSEEVKWTNVDFILSEYFKGSNDDDDYEDLPQSVDFKDIEQDDDNFPPR